MQYIFKGNIANYYNISVFDAGKYSNWALEDELNMFLKSVKYKINTPWNRFSWTKRLDKINKIV